MQLVTFLQKSPMVIGTIIAALLAYQLALLTWTFLPEDKPSLLWKPVAANTKQSQSQVNVHKLQQMHLFGEKVEVAKPVVQQTTISSAPKTRLNLKLVGVVAATDPNNSSAIIDNKGKQSSYFIDSEIDNSNAVITKIYQDRIILEVNGSLETLMLDGVESFEKQYQNSINNSQQTTSSTTRKVIQEQPKTVNLNRKELLSNPGKLTDYIRISPVRENGQVKGYRVNPGKDKALFEQAGLQRGDLAVELNGIDLTDTQQAITLMKEFPTMTDMTLSVERDGQLHELYFSIP